MALRTETGSLQSYEIVEAAGTNVAVPDASLLFTGEYSRAGSDLILTGSDGAKLVVTGYFNTDTPPSLVSPEGAMLTGDVVTSLAGPQFPGQYAQAGGGTGQAAESIGKVQTLEGGATVIRANGVSETLKVGDPVFQGDVVMTGPGGKLGISFLDGTLFSLSNNARMVLNKLVYEPNGSDNSMLFNLVEGTFVFAAGKIAPTGDMKVQTPVATMGIRGTTPTVDINASLGTVNFSIVPDPNDQAIGMYKLFSLVTGLEIGTVQSIGTIWRIVSATGEVVQIDKTQDDLLKDAEAIGQINSVYSSWSSTQQQDPEGPQAGPNNNSGSGGINSDPPNPGNIDGNGGETDGGENQENQNENDGDPNDQSGLPPTETDEDDVVDTPTDVAGDTGPNVINGDENPNVLNGTPNNDIINGFEDEDTIFGSPGEDQIDGGEDDDTVDYSATSQGIVINLVDGTVNGEEIGFDTIASIERFVAGSGNDTLIFDEDTGFFFDGRGGVDTIRFVGGVDIHTDFTDIEAENIEILDLNKTDDNTLTLAADDVSEANEEGILQIRGGGGDVVNLTNDFFQDGGFTVSEAVNAPALDSDQVSDVAIFRDNFPHGFWKLSEQTFTDEDGTEFDVYEFFLPGSSEPVATARIEQGIEVNTPGSVAISEQVGDEVFLQGAFLELGISKSGTLGSDQDAPDGFHPTGGRDELGLVFDQDGFDRANDPDSGDVSLPGVPEDSFSIGFSNGEVNQVFTNAERNGATDINTTTTNTSSGARLSALTTGLVGGVLAFSQEVSFNAFDTYFTTTITLTNTGDATLQNVRFMRSLDPDQDVDFGENFPTENDVFSNPTDQGGAAAVQALGRASDVSVNLVSTDPDARGSVFGFANRDPYDDQAFDNPRDPDGQFEDDAIAMTFDIGDLAPGETVTKTFYTSMNQNDPETGAPIGTDGNDLLVGTDDDDVIAGNGGNDLIFGNGGSDRFVISSLADGVDTIVDFASDDTLDLTGLLDGVFDPDNDDINEFVRATTDANGNTTVAVDVDGADGPADFADVAILQGVAAGVAVAVNIGDESEAVTSAAVAV